MKCFTWLRYFLVWTPLSLPYSLSLPLLPVVLWLVRSDAVIVSWVNRQGVDRGWHHHHRVPSCMCHWVDSQSQRGLCLTPIFRPPDPTSTTSLWVHNQCIHTHTPVTPHHRHPSPKYCSTILLSDFHVCSILAIQCQASPTFYRPLYVCANANVSIRKSLIGPPK